MAASASGWDMNALVVLPAETGTPRAGGTLFPGGSYALAYDNLGRAMGDEFDGSALNPHIWNVQHNTTDNGRGVHSSDNILVNGSVCELQVTQVPGSSKILCGGADGGAATNGYGWLQHPGTLVVWASRRPDGTENGLKQIVLNWEPDLPYGDGSWPPENDGEEHFGGDKAYVQITTHDRSLGRGNNHQTVTKVLDSCTASPKWSTWHRFAMLNQGRDSWYFIDHNDGRGFVLAAHHVVPEGAEIGDMRFLGIGHHNTGGNFILSKPLYRFQLDYVAYMTPAADPTIDGVAWDRSPNLLVPPQPAEVLVTGTGRSAANAVSLSDDSGDVEALVSDALNPDGTYSTTFQLQNPGTVTGSLTVHVGTASEVIAAPYDDTVVYSLGDMITDWGNVYYCRADGTTGHEPAQSNSLGQIGSYWRRYL